MEFIVTSLSTVFEAPEAGTVPAGHFDQLPKVTMQLPIFNEVYVVERLSVP